jgi:aminopeptidase N
MLALLALCFLWKMLAAAQTPFAPKGDGEAPDRTIDVQHYRIELSFDESKRMVFGKTTITFVPFSSGFTTADFDAENLAITEASQGMKSLPFVLGPKSVTVTLDHPVTLRDTLAITLTYSCTPQRGLYFVQPDSAEPLRPWQIWSQGEDMDNHFWFPCHDFPDDFATSEMIVTVKDSYSALSNGKLVDVRLNRSSHTKTFHWKQDIPHVAYLIMLAAGEYSVIKDKSGSVPVEYWVYPQNVDDAKVCFAETPAMISWFGFMTGYPYPWAKYAQVLIHDFVVGGMENTSATALSDRDAVYGPRARVDDSPNSLIAHELAHQWWGDVVTCRDWRHLWLNESFASYFDLLWQEHTLGQDEFTNSVWISQQSGINQDRASGRKPIVSVGTTTSNLYPRGASVLHMLRFVLGDSLFWRATHHYIVKYQHSPVETNDLKVAIEEATGKNLYWFFNEWLYGAGHPVFELTWDWNDSSLSAQVHVRQTQTIDSLTSVFRMPVNIGLVNPSGVSNSRVEIMTADTTFVLSAASKPLTVLFDNGGWLLKEVHWKKSVEEWAWEAEHAPGQVDRKLAVSEVSHQEGAGALLLLDRVVKNDKFWGVRLQAINEVDSCASSDSSSRALGMQILTRGSHDPESAVREGAVRGLGVYRTPDARLILWEALKDSSERVVAATLRALAKADSAQAMPALQASLTMPSRRNVIATAALGALGSVDSTLAVKIALEKVKRGHPEEIRSAALGILRRYARHMDEVKDALLSILGERRSYLRSQAIRLLGDVGDERALPGLKKVAEDTNDWSAGAAKSSIEKIGKRVSSQK